MTFFRTLLAGCIATALVAGPASAGFKWIKKEADFRQMIVGKKLVAESGWSIAHPDGRLVGKFKPGKLRGNWLWQGRYWCRNALVGGKELGTNCQKVEIDGNTMRLTRDKGKGKVTLWTLE